MTDILADARRWLAEQPRRVQTHSDACHTWHPACLVARLCARIDTLQAENADYRREVREQRLEIAGLREERAALVQMDRPNIDRFIGDSAGISTDSSGSGR